MLQYTKKPLNADPTYNKDSIIFIDDLSEALDYENNFIKNKELRQRAKEQGKEIARPGLEQVIPSKRGRKKKSQGLAETEEVVSARRKTPSKNADPNNVRSLLSPPTHLFSSPGVLSNLKTILFLLSDQFLNQRDRSAAVPYFHSI